MIVDRAEGARVWDADGNSYIDYVCSWGALILGHADPGIAAAVAEQARRGTSYGMTSELEVELATMLRARDCLRCSACDSFPRARKPP